MIQIKLQKYEYFKYSYVNKIIAKNPNFEYNYDINKRTQQ